MARRAVSAPSVGAAAPSLIEIIVGFRDDPLGFVMFVFPWGVKGTRLHDQDGPDAWQQELLTDLGEESAKRGLGAALAAIMFAVASGHGTGKTALVSWIILWFLSTRLDPACVVTANTLGQLTGKTWRELSKWHRLAIHREWFVWTATKFYMVDRPETHAALAVPWSKEKSEGFAGTHEKDVLIIFDEASAIADEIWTVTEGAMTTDGAMWICFGNPTRNQGRFRECWREFRHRWRTYEVDSRNAKMANKAQIKQWVDDYGEDSDFVRVRVRGIFPRAASMQLISEETVDQAMAAWVRTHGDRLTKAVAVGPGGLERYRLEQNPLAPRIMTVDVARFGADQTVIGMRCGRTFVVLGKYRELETTQVAYRVFEWWSKEHPDHLLVDEVGVGAGVVDVLTEMGVEVIGVNAGVKAMQPNRFLNRRAEMMWLANEWLKEGGMIPPDKELRMDLTSPEYGFSDRTMKVQIEGKDEMRARGLPSPDVGDTLAMSFFIPFGPKAGAETVEMVLARGGMGGNGNGGGAGGAPSWMSA